MISQQNYEKAQPVLEYEVKKKGVEYKSIQKRLGYIFRLEEKGQINNKR